MDRGIATVLAACIAAIAALIAAIIAKYDIHLLFRRTDTKIEGEWRGFSVYLAGKVYDPTTEALYKVNAIFKQFGSRVTMKEKIDEFFDIRGNRLEGIVPRQINGKGKVIGSGDVIITFTEAGSRTCGTMYLKVNTYNNEIEGILAVRNPHIGTPVAVKLLLRPMDKPPVQPHDLEIEHIQSTFQGNIGLKQIKN